MKTLTRMAADGHRVRCTTCDYEHIHRDVRDAVDDYVDHECGEVER